MMDKYFRREVDCLDSLPEGEFEAHQEFTQQSQLEFDDFPKCKSCKKPATHDYNLCIGCFYGYTKEDWKAIQKMVEKAGL